LLEDSRDYSKHINGSYWLTFAHLVDGKLACLIHIRS